MILPRHCRRTPHGKWSGIHPAVSPPSSIHRHHRPRPTSPRAGLSGCPTSRFWLLASGFSVPATASLRLRSGPPPAASPPRRIPVPPGASFTSFGERALHDKKRKPHPSPRPLKPRFALLEQFSGWRGGNCGPGFQPAPQCYINLKSALTLRFLTFLDRSINVDRPASASSLHFSPEPSVPRCARQWSRRAGDSRDRDRIAFGPLSTAPPSTISRSADAPWRDSFLRRAWCIDRVTPCRSIGSAVTACRAVHTRCVANLLIDDPPNHAGRCFPEVAPRGDRFQLSVFGFQQEPDPPSHRPTEN